MATRHYVDLPPADVILAILADRPWPMNVQHVWTDFAWNFIHYSEPAQWDYPEGAPSSTTLERTLRELVAGGLVQAYPGEPLHVCATDRGWSAGRKPRDLIVAAIARSS